MHLMTVAGRTRNSVMHNQCASYAASPLATTCATNDPREAFIYRVARPSSSKKIQHQDVAQPHRHVSATRRNLSKATVDPILRNTGRARFICGMDRRATGYEVGFEQQTERPESRELPSRNPGAIRYRIN